MDCEEAKARQFLREAAAAHGLDVLGGKMRRTSSRFCLGVEHGDYNGTELLGVGTDRYIWFAYKPNGTHAHRLYSVNFPRDGVVTVPCGGVKDPVASEVAGKAWGHFAEGVEWVLRHELSSAEQAEYGPLDQGIDGVLYGNIPGGGMSRSASLTINLLLSVLDANGVQHLSIDECAPTVRDPACRYIDPMRVVDLSQAVENKFIGSPCGNLDQVMIMFGKAGCATRYDPATRRATHVTYGGAATAAAATKTNKSDKINDNNSNNNSNSESFSCCSSCCSAGEEFRILVLDTGTTRAGLEKSTYAVRAAECKELCALAGAKHGFRLLGDIKDEEAYRRVAAEYGASHPNLVRRLQYIYEAQQRFADMLGAWQAGDIARVGALFRLDGIGLRDVYQISGPELEAMCDIARTVPGVYGERMLGGGDKGAAGLICSPEAVPWVRAAVATSYPRGHPEYADKWAVHECKFVQGVSLLDPLN